jgi:hypothetical protein
MICETQVVRVSGLTGKVIEAADYYTQKIGEINVLYMYVFIYIYICIYIYIYIYKCKHEFID